MQKKELDTIVDVNEDIEEVKEEEDLTPLIDTNLFKEHIHTKIINIFQNVRSQIYLIS